ncbi:MAG TPA: ATP-binding protein [Anaerolineae bacterium]|nr:hypothetical protein [Anaerolineae bacterium]MCB9107022.1 hypothetical protein [Anaerolineales bacterium]HRV93643.1 ATP-binding protein [Anaerolineae bacterium]
MTQHSGEPNLEDDRLIFVDSVPNETVDKINTWKVMLVDDKAEAHQVARLALQKFKFEDKPLQFISAYSADEAQQLIEAHPDTALILLDIVMEENDSGLKVANYIRNILKNRLVRIVLRTGQPGQAPEEAVIMDYDINDYKVKTELTREKLLTTVMGALRSYRDIQTVEINRQELAALYADLEKSHVDLAQAKEAAETASQAKTTFLANMSHELRTPLSAILGYAQLLYEDAAQLGYEEFEADLLKIQSAGEHLLLLVNEILDIAKLQADKLVLQIEPFLVKTLVEDVVGQVQATLVANKNSLEVDLAENLGTMKTDQSRVRQILRNILDNAAKFTENGIVRLTVYRESDLASHPATDWLIFQVSDTGIGMSPAQLEQIFEAFTQVDMSTRRKYGGIGLGLAITHDLCRLMDGDIAVASELGQGSRFTVRLPAEVAKFSSSVQD